MGAHTAFTLATYLRKAGGGLEATKMQLGGSWGIFKMRVLLVSLAFSGLLLSAMPAQAQVVDYTKPVAKEIETAVEDGAVDLNSLSPEQRFSRLEKKYFGHGYPDDKLEDRLFRMENLVFGSQTHAPVPERIFKLEAVLTKSAQATTNPALNPGEVGQSATLPPPGIPVPFTGSASGATAKAKPASFNSLFLQAQEDIDATRYHAAAEELEQAIKLNPNNAKAYSMLGDTLLKLQDREGAKEAFKACFQVDPFGAEGRGAKEMLLKMVADDTVRAAAPQDTPQVVEHTIRTLNNQAADLANRYRQEGNQWSNFRRYLGNLEARKVEWATNGYRGPEPGYGGRFTGYGNGFGANGGYGGNNGFPAAYGPNFGGGYGAGGGYGGGYGGGGFGGGGGAFVGYDGGGYGGGGGRGGREISNLGRLQSNYLRSDAIVQANKARYEAAQKAAFVQESAANLKDQLLKPSALKDDARLKALGTSLYCRYYGDETPSTDDPVVPADPVLELRAKALGLKHK